MFIQEWIWSKNFLFSFALQKKNPKARTIQQPTTIEFYGILFDKKFITYEKKWNHQNTACEIYSFIDSQRHDMNQDDKKKKGEVQKNQKTTTKWKPIQPKEFCPLFSLSVFCRFSKCYFNKICCIENYAIKLKYFRHFASEQKYKYRVARWASFVCR